MDEIAKNGGVMTEELDIICNTYLVNARKAAEIINSGRIPITRKFTVITKLFTELESKLSYDVKGTVPFQIKMKRFEFAEAEKKRKAELANEKQKEIDQARERIEIKGDAELKLYNEFTRILARNKQSLSNLITNMTLDCVDLNIELIATFEELYAKEIHDRIAIQVSPRHISQEEADKILDVTRSAKYPFYKEEYSREIGALKTEMSDKVNGRVDFLTELEEADAAKKEEMEAIEKEHKEKEKERIAEEAAAKKLAKETDIQTQKAAEGAKTLFDIDMNSAETESKAVSRSVIEIEVLSPSGYYSLFQLFMEQEGMKQTVEQLSKKSFKSLIVFAQNHAKDTGEILESPYLVYNAKQKVSIKK